jgi:hypothetical protein
VAQLVHLSVCLVHVSQSLSSTKIPLEAGSETQALVCWKSDKIFNNTYCIILWTAACSIKHITDLTSSNRNVHHMVQFNGCGMPVSPQWMKRPHDQRELFMNWEAE